MPVFHDKPSPSGKLSFCHFHIGSFKYFFVTRLEGGEAVQVQSIYLTIRYDSLSLLH